MSVISDGEAAFKNSNLSSFAKLFNRRPMINSKVFSPEKKLSGVTRIPYFLLLSIHVISGVCTASVKPKRELIGWGICTRDLGCMGIACCTRKAASPVGEMMMSRSVSVEKRMRDRRCNGLSGCPAGNHNLQ
jgi:hypothetical protein